MCNTVVILVACKKFVDDFLMLWSSLLVAVRAHSLPVHLALCLQALPLGLLECDRNTKEVFANDTPIQIGLIFVYTTS